jgi:hypothetical protein
MERNCTWLLLEVYPPSQRPLFVLFRFLIRLSFLVSCSGECEKKKWKERKKIKRNYLRMVSKGSFSDAPASVCN